MFPNKQRSSYSNSALRFKMEERTVWFKILTFFIVICVSDPSNTSYCFFCHRNFNAKILRNICIFIVSQELGELQEAKQLLIQQKLELQAQVEAAQGSLKQEQKEHQATKDSRSEREEQLLAQIRDVQDHLVGSLKSRAKLEASLLFSDTVNSSIKRQQRRKQEKSK